MPSHLAVDTDYGVGSGARPYLHFFRRGDDDVEYHNHPWRVCVSFILAGGYREFKWNHKTGKVTERILRPGAFNILRREDFHRVELLDESVGCWTIFISVDRLAKSDGTDWGFMNIDTHEYTPWLEFVRRKSERIDASRDT
jgi:hypothetical protein